MATATLGPALADLGALAVPKKSKLGVCIHSYALRNRADRAGPKATDHFAEPLNFLEYCHRFGAGGVQVGIGRRDDAHAARIRRQAETYGMFVEGIADLPRTQSDIDRFEAELLAAKNSGAKVVRVVLLPSKVSGRRYEEYSSADEFYEACKRGRQMLEVAEPIAARHHIRLAVENHKDQRIPEMLQTIRAVSSEYVGVCVDTGNSIALLEDPMEVIESYAAWAYAVHLKDIAVQQYQDGFLLWDVPLGQGFLDLPKAINIIRSHHREVQFSLEMMTRDPLKVPCLTQKYWAVLADVPGYDLARTLKLVRTHEVTSPGGGPKIGHLPLSEQLHLEQDNVEKSLAYAREHLGL
jgi:sugar phosphate isomerase/epimerase